MILHEIAYYMILHYFTCNKDYFITRFSSPGSSGYLPCDKGIDTLIQVFFQVVLASVWILLSVAYW